MSISRRILPRDGDVGLLLALLVIAPNGDVRAPQPPARTPAVITCSASVAPTVVLGAPAMLVVELRNGGKAAVAVLNWGTPFEEAWLQPFVDVSRDGTPLAYGGAKVKRGDPERDEYFTLAASQRRSARIDLAEVFDLRATGRYVVTPQLVLHDVAPADARLPRTRAAHAGMPLHCAPVEFRVVKGK